MLCLAACLGSKGVSLTNEEISCFAPVLAVDSVIRVTCNTHKENEVTRGFAIAVFPEKFGLLLFGIDVFD